ESSTARGCVTREVAVDGATLAVPGIGCWGWFGPGSAVLTGWLIAGGSGFESLAVYTRGGLIMSQEKKESLVVTTSGKRSIHDVARDLKDAGFEVDQVLDSINVVTGKGDAGKLRSVQDVVDVSGDTPIDIGPPGSSVS